MLSTAAAAGATSTHSVSSASVNAVAGEANALSGVATLISSNVSISYASAPACAGAADAATTRVDAARSSAASLPLDEKSIVSSDSGEVIPLVRLVRRVVVRERTECSSHTGIGYICACGTARIFVERRVFEQDFVVGMRVKARWMEHNISW